MSRMARIISGTGVYHVMLRGIDKREVFLNRADYEKFLYYIKKAKEKSGFDLLAYCLMPNHVHLLIKEGNEAVGHAIRRITVGYVQYHNLLHERTGHLFQNRFKSEAVEDEKYLLTVMRYIHQNPLKAGIVNDISKYRWSSYQEYLMNEYELIDKSIIISYFPDKNAFIKYNGDKCEEECMDITEKIRCTDIVVAERVSEILEDVRVLREMEARKRNDVLKKIKEHSGASSRQLERVLGIGKNIIERA